MESSHQVVTALGAIRTEGLPVALAEPAIHAAISVMATVAIAPSFGAALAIMSVKPPAPRCGPRLSCARPEPSTMAQPSTVLTKSSVFDA